MRSYSLTAYWGQLNGGQTLLKFSVPADGTEETLVMYRKGAIRISWGDGSYTDYTGSAKQGQHTHTYGLAGEYFVKVTPWENIADLRCNSADLQLVVTLPDCTNDALVASAFNGASSLPSIKLPDTLKVLNGNAFDHCAALELDALPDGVTSIGQYAFRECANLALTRLPDGISAIPNYTFVNCPKLALTALPSGLASIGVQAFMRCTGMRLREIPASVKTIGNQAFRYNSGMYEDHRILFCWDGENYTRPTSIGNCFLDNSYHCSDVYVPWASGEVSGAGWGGNAVHYNAKFRTRDELEQHLDSVPVLYHPMNEMLDTTPTGQSCTLTGTCTATTDAGIDCLNFPSGAYNHYLIHNPFTKSYGYAKQFSVSFWMRLTEDAVNGIVFFRLGCSATGAGCSFLVGVPNGNSYGVCACATGNSTLMQPANLTALTLFPRTDMNWHHVVMRCYNTPGWTASLDNTIEAWLDGERVGEVSHRFSSNSGYHADFLVGKWATNGACNIAGLRLYARLISAERIAELYNEYHPTE